MPIAKKKRRTKKNASTTLTQWSTLKQALQAGTPTSQECSQDRTSSRSYASSATTLKQRVKEILERTLKPEGIKSGADIAHEMGVPFTLGVPVYPDSNISGYSHYFIKDSAQYSVVGPKEVPFKVESEEPVKTEAGTKHDSGKPEMAYLPSYALEQVALVMGYGAKKYGGHNYLGGIAYLRLISAGLRHTFSYLRGIDLDHESGLPHWAHAAACLLMLGEMTQHHPELDDRFKGAKK